ncbi:MAG TPA: hypothetical protein EYN69_13570 [Flavobacteriales bacterium]|nr:hypothetical protein [Flavobacteriales bacterium]
MRKRMAEFLAHLHSKYDFVVVDTPPVGLVTDALEVIKKADLPIYVLRADYSRRQFLEGVNKLMRDNKINKLSIILNDFGRGASGKSYSYAYGYDYDYGYGYGYAYSSSYGYGYYTDEPEKKGSLFSRLFGKT